MPNENEKDFNSMLNDSKDMPKIQIITDEKSIEKYGGNRMYFAPPIDYDRVMKLIPYGKVITIGKIREYFAKQHQADFTEPITAGIFVSISAWASYQRSENETPKWRIKSKISWGNRRTEIKIRSRGTHNSFKGENKCEVLCKGL